MNKYLVEAVEILMTRPVAVFDSQQEASDYCAKLNAEVAQLMVKMRELLSDGVLTDRGLIDSAKDIVLPDYYVRVVAAR